MTTQWEKHLQSICEKFPLIGDMVEMVAEALPIDLSDEDDTQEEIEWDTHDYTLGVYTHANNGAPIGEVIIKQCAVVEIDDEGWHKLYGEDGEMLFASRQVAYITMVDDRVEW